MLAQIHTYALTYMHTCILTNLLMYIPAFPPTYLSTYLLTYSDTYVFEVCCIALMFKYLKFCHLGSNHVEASCFRA